MSQTIFERNGTSYTFDFNDPEHTEKLEEATDYMVEEARKLDPTDKTSVAIRQQCGLVKRYFDHIFGEGAGVALCGEKDIYNVCVRTYAEFLDFVSAQKDDLLNVSNTFRKYSNRTSRKPQDH